jgi:group II intron reverse transcriptase/maturase
MNAEQSSNGTCRQRNSAEHEKYAGGRRSFRLIWEERDSAQPDLLERIVALDNFAAAYKEVKKNHGAPGVDGMTIEEAKDWLNANWPTLVETIKKGKYSPSPVRRVKIPKPDGGVRNLGVPTVIDRVVQQAIKRVIQPIYEPLFADGSYGYRPHRCAQDAIRKVKEYAEQGYTRAVVLDLSKFFDTLDHNLLLTILRRTIRDERVVQLIKRFLKAGVMDEGVYEDTDQGSAQGGPLSPLLSCIYLNEFDQEFTRRGVPWVRYADDIVLFARSERAAERLLGTSTDFLENRLKLTVNRTKSRTVSVYAIRNFKYLGFALGKSRDGVYIRAHAKSVRKFKSNLRNLSSRRCAQSIKPALEKIKRAASGWLNYYAVADMKTMITELNSWLYHRIRMCIWKQWKRVRTRYRNLRKFGVRHELAYMAANSRRGYWFTSNTVAVVMAMTKERLVKSGFYDLLDAYKSLHSRKLAQ